MHQLGARHGLGSTLKIQHARDRPLISHPAAASTLCRGVASHERQSEASAQAGARPWLSFAPPLVWQGSEQDALTTPIPLSPLWKLMLLSDGSVTRHLQILTGSKVHVECLEMANIGDDAHGLPAEAQLIKGPRVQRQVLLRPHDGAGPVLVYATSWWDAAVVDVYLTDVQKPIWVNLAEGHFELYRDIQALECGSDEAGQLAAHFGCPGPFWGRQYAFWHKDKPLTLIREVFSPRLAEYLGPVHPPAQ